LEGDTEKNRRLFLFTCSNSADIEMLDDADADADADVENVDDAVKDATPFF